MALTTRKKGPVFRRGARVLKGPAPAGSGDAPTPKSKENQVARFIDELKRTHRCGALRATDIGKEVVLFGWVARSTRSRRLVFIDLRDREGVTQIVFDPDASKEAHKLAEALRGEWVIGVRGKVRSRGEQFARRRTRWSAPPTRTSPPARSRSRCSRRRSSTSAETPPFEIDDKIDTREEKRLEYRYLDLRRAAAAEERCVMRHKHQPGHAQLLLRPRLPRARDAVHGEVHAGRRAQLPRALAPARAGKFYALAESPQLFKQLFMVRGLRPLLPDREVLPRRGLCASIASPSSRRSTSRCRSSTRTTSSR